MTRDDMSTIVHVMKGNPEMVLAALNAAEERR